VKKLEAKAMEPEAQPRRAPRAVVRAVEPRPARRAKRRQRDRGESQSASLEAATCIDPISPPSADCRRVSVNPPEHPPGRSWRGPSFARSLRTPASDTPLEPSLDERDAEPPATQAVTASAASPDDLLGPSDMAQLIEVFTVLDRWARELEDGK
jgi:hypothetical protein